MASFDIVWFNDNTNSVKNCVELTLQVIYVSTVLTFMLVLKVTDTHALSAVRSRNTASSHCWFDQLTLYDGGCYHIETSPLIGSASQWTGFYMITASFMKGLTGYLQF